MHFTTFKMYSSDGKSESSLKTFRFTRHLKVLITSTLVTAEDLWGGVFGVSNAGRKRGRGKHGRRKVDLNKGQVIGLGKYLHNKFCYSITTLFTKTFYFVMLHLTMHVRI